jgi:hypothetical protein
MATQNQSSEYRVSVTAKIILITLSLLSFNLLACDLLNDIIFQIKDRGEKQNKPIYAPGQVGGSEDLPPGNEQPAGDQAQANSPTVQSEKTIIIPQGNPEGNIKPVGFKNIGTQAFTVQPWTYEPFDESLPPILPNASTVAFPGDTGYLSLPLGSYTWCYWWELGDINEDGNMEYAYAIDEREVILDASDTDDLDFAEKVELSVLSGQGEKLGLCGMDISPFMVEQQHVDTIKGAILVMGHDGDYVVLTGPITILYWYIHAEQQIVAGGPREITPPEMVTIPAGQNQKFLLYEYQQDHPGDWNLYIMLISVDQ